jgi:hypothetical protein
MFIPIMVAVLFFSTGKLAQDKFDLCKKQGFKSETCKLQKKLNALGGK